MMPHLHGSPLRHTHGPPPVGGVLDDPIHHQRVLDGIRDRMAPHGIGHVTFQLEPERLHQIARPEWGVLPLTAGESHVTDRSILVCFST